METYAELVKQKKVLVSKQKELQELDEKHTREKKRLQKLYEKHRQTLSNQFNSLRSNYRDNFWKNYLSIREINDYKIKYSMHSLECRKSYMPKLCETHTYSYSNSDYEIKIFFESDKEKTLLLTYGFVSPYNTARYMRCRSKDFFKRGIPILYSNECMNAHHEHADDLPCLLPLTYYYQLDDCYIRCVEDRISYDEYADYSRELTGSFVDLNTHTLNIQTLGEPCCSWLHCECDSCDDYLDYDENICKCNFQPCINSVLLFRQVQAAKKIQRYVRIWLDKPVYSNGHVGLYARKSLEECR